MAQKERVQKIMAERGVGSRRYCDALVEAGRVTVNGRPVEIGTKVDPESCIIAVDGKNIGGRTSPKKKYFILYKPRGYVTTMKDEMDRKCVAQFVDDLPERIYPVGRLDRNSEGLLIMTNDGELANLLMHPSSHVPKKYRVTVAGSVEDEALVAMSEGIVIDGERTAPCMIHVLQKEAGRTVLEMTLFEGKNRQIRKMCEAVGLEVSRLKRISIGPVKLGMLGPGQKRELTSDEVRSLKIAATKQEGRFDD